MFNLNGKYNRQANFVIVLILIFYENVKHVTQLNVDFLCPTDVVINYYD